MTGFTSDELLLSLDPSSTITGYALFSITPRGLHLKESGTLTGKSGTDAVARVLEMRRELLIMLREHRPRIMLVEIPTGKQYTRKGERTTGFPVWAGAAWALWMVCEDWAERIEGHQCFVHPVSNTEWTRGQSKSVRQTMVTLQYPEYDAEKDKGANKADAISMALWWEPRAPKGHDG